MKQDKAKLAKAAAAVKEAVSDDFEGSVQFHIARKRKQVKIELREFEIVEAQ